MAPKIINYVLLDDVRTMQKADQIFVVLLQRKPAFVRMYVAIRDDAGLLAARTTT